MGGQEATPGEPSCVCELMGELALWGGPLKGREPFTRESTAALERATVSFPFSNKADVIGPERDGEERLLGRLKLPR